jgi:peptidyl-prolyl cis-trans isomerase B (cyclophilin B)
MLNVSVRSGERVNHKSKVEQAVKDLKFGEKNYQIQLETSKGTITLDLMPDVAPQHCKNMLGLTKIGFYDGLVFHRVIDGFMIQGGCPQGTGTGGPGYNVDAEFNSTPHTAGVLSMARSSDPNSAGSQFFVCLGAHAHLNGKYTAFGKTADEASMAVVRSIGSVKTDSRDRPREDVVIRRAIVVET